MSGSLRVGLGSTDCGAVSGDRDQSIFWFKQSYLDMPSRPVLGQWFEDRLSTKGRRSRGLLPWFENLLPERGGELRARLCRTMALDEDDDFALLGALGDQLPGSVIVGIGAESQVPGKVVDEPSEPARAMQVSLGGMQLKFALSGPLDRLTVGVAMGGEEEWILKVPSPGLPLLPENEAAIMRWCRSSGFDVPEVHVVTAQEVPAIASLLGDQRGFLVRRYDRTPAGRLHQEDFAQVLNIRPGAKYDGAGIVKLAKAAQIILGQPGVHEFFRRLVVVIATGNADAHLKNWSLIYPDGLRARWSPLYDQVATIAFPLVERRLALRIGNAKHFPQMTAEPLLWLGDRLGLQARVVQELIDQTVEALRAAFDPEALGMPPALAEVLRAHWREVPLLKATPLPSR